MPWFNIKMQFYQYRKSHCGDKTVSYLHNGISYTGKMASLYWIRALMITKTRDYVYGIWQYKWHITVTSQWVPWCLKIPGSKSPVSRLFAEPFIQVHIKENIKLCVKKFPFDDVFMNKTLVSAIWVTIIPNNGLLLVIQPYKWMKMWCLAAAITSDSKLILWRQASNLSLFGRDDHVGCVSYNGNDKSWQFID